MAPIHVLHGQPTPEELATVLAVVQSRAAAPPAPAQPPPPPRPHRHHRARGAAARAP
ncbi:acyl-CoA carboxylase epsilon subunit, partial [Kitasatospora purpeofusca]|uniref:acyl-CoA carboxylase epsilon subunit n=1 Tax=Kitasatospora purpeofusca TaxID=67352 RepID=UPI003694359E